MSKKREFINSLKGINESDLQGKITEDKMRIKRMKFAHSVSPLEDPMTIRELRKDVARAMTELKNRKLSVQTENK